MKKILLSVSLLASVVTYAQMTHDFQITLTAPADASSFTPSQDLGLVINVKNTGTTPINAADTLLFSVALNNQFLPDANTGTQAFFYLKPHGTIAVGANENCSVPLALNFSQDIIDATFCVYGYFLVAGHILTTSETTSADDSDCKTYSFTLVSTPELELAKESVKVYPNPAKDVVNIKVNYSKAVSISILDVTGRQIDVLNVNTANSIYSVNTSSFDNGIYFYQVNSEDGVIKSGRFAVSK